ncbi:XK-related protein 2 [Tachyglossus aculeatus]|uniref:XK-related protein 2 n=1 Tax=Tachyglossus aculeatus TaxID=9261 RepID=UPI0018F5093A|nr:XK-related protein 2 [Tachyglossus aculeatus]XP_038604124.1 XK-related protein 2 [Tachyglossus aculeatus]
MTMGQIISLDFLMSTNADAPDAADAADSPEAADAPDSPDLADAPDTADAPYSHDSADAAVAPDSPDFDDSRDAPDFADDPDAPDSPDIADYRDAPNFVDTPDAPDSPDFADTAVAPDSPTFEDSRDAPDFADAPVALDSPDFADSRDTPDLADTPGAPDSPNFADSRDAPDFADTPGAPDSPDFADSRDAPDFVDTPGAPDSPDFADSRNAPNFADAPDAPDSPNFADFRDAPDFANAPDAPDSPDFANARYAPEFSDAPNFAGSLDASNFAGSLDASKFASASSLADAPGGPEAAAAAGGPARSKSPDRAIDNRHTTLTELDEVVSASPQGAKKYQGPACVLTIPKTEELTEILVEESASSLEESVVKLGSKTHLTFPLGIIFTTFLYCGEASSALYMANIYRKNKDSFWMTFTFLFFLLSSIMDQFTLVFIHRDLAKDKPLMVFTHLLLLGPIFRCLEAIIMYLNLGKKVEEEPYVGIIRKRLFYDGMEELVEWEVGHSIRILSHHRHAFKRMAVMQAYLGSVPQLTYQTYVTLISNELPLPRAVLIGFSLVSVTFGSTLSTTLTLQIKYDEYKTRLGFWQFVCIVTWRTLEIITRLAILVVFSLSMKLMALPFIFVNFLATLFEPWVRFWMSGAKLPVIERTLTCVGTTVVLITVTVIHTGINYFSWSAMQLRLDQPELMKTTPGWGAMMLHYSIRLVEDITLVTIWLVRPEKVLALQNLCRPYIAVQLLVGQLLSFVLLLFFFQYLHPFRALFPESISEYIHRKCRWPCWARARNPAPRDGVV